MRVFATSVASVTSIGVNPFEAGNWYVNPANMAEYDGSIETASGVTKANLEGMKVVPSAYWIDVKAKIDDTSLRGMRGILADAKTKNQLVVFMHYDVPNRDCKAVASNGEICCTYKADGRCDYTASGSCAEGLNEYKTEYVDPFVKAIKDFPTVQVVVVVEPDSLPNLATNLDNPKCGNPATQASYKDGIAYAIKQLQTTHATIYIDAAHGGWLGWDDNLQKFLGLFKTMNVDMSGVRGFAQNVANYQAVGTMCPWAPDQGTRNGYCLPGGTGGSSECCSDPCKLVSQYNPCVNEMNFAQALSKASTEILSWTPVNIIDTGRNGVVDARTDCANWCNPRNMGSGLLPTTSTGSDIVDAFFWLKTPGESDGCTQELPDGTACPRFDTMCGSSDSIGSRSGEPRSPEAGHWFDYQVKQLALNAVDTKWPGPVPPSPPVPTPTPTPPAPTPADCPGGSLSACIALCPTDQSIYKTCVQTCVDRCGGTPPTPSPAPAPVPVPTPVPTPPTPTPGGATCCMPASPCAAADPSSCVTDGWCAQSQGNCEGNCNGSWCLDNIV